MKKMNDIFLSSDKQAIVDKSRLRLLLAPTNSLITAGPDD